MWILIRWSQKKKTSIGLSKRLPQRPSPHLTKNIHKHTHQPPPPQSLLPSPSLGRVWLPGWLSCLHWQAFVWGLTRRAYGRCPSAHSSSPPPGSEAYVSPLCSQYDWASCAIHRMLFLFVCLETLLWSRFPEQNRFNPVSTITCCRNTPQNRSQEHTMIIIKSQKKNLTKCTKRE